MSRLDFASGTSFNAEMYGAQTVGSTVQIDNMQAFAASFVVTDGTPAPVTYLTTDVTAGADAIKITGHTFKNGTLVQVTTGTTVPGGLSANTNYWVIVVDANNIALATSRANALAGTKIDITNGGTGTQSIKATALAGVDLHLEKSIDGVTWSDIANSTATNAQIAAAANDVLSFSNIAYNFIRAEMTLTSGQPVMTVKFRSQGLA